MLNQKQARLYVINAAKIARECGLAARINTVMQMAFFHLTNILPGDSALMELQGRSPKATAAKVRNWLSATGRRWRWPANRCSRCRCSRSMPAVRTGRQWCLTPPRISSKPSRRRCLPDWETPFPSLRFRLTAPGRWARPAGKNEHCRSDSYLERRAVHPVQSLRGGLPTLGYSRQSGVTRSVRWRTGKFALAGCKIPRYAWSEICSSGGAGRLYRL